MVNQQKQTSSPQTVLGGKCLLDVQSFLEPLNQVVEVRLHKSVKTQHNLTVYTIGQDNFSALRLVIKVVHYQKAIK